MVSASQTLIAVASATTAGWNKMTVKTFAIKLLSIPSVPYYSPGQVAEGTLHIVNDQECTTKGKILGRKVCIR